MIGQKFEKIVGAKISDVAKIWDSLAPVRYEDIRSGKDRSYTEVLLPLLEDFSKENSGTKLVDVGCGVGFGSKVAARYFETVHAIDPSSVSIALAKERNSASNIKYITSNAESFYCRNEEYDALISSMVLMDCPNAKAFLAACHSMVKTGGKLIFTLCHPFFWPRYWGFEKYQWFSYNSEIAVQSYFRTSSTGLSDSKTIYFHRPISAYISELSKLGFEKIEMREISGIVIKSKVKSRYPRYISLEVTK